MDTLRLVAGDQLPALTFELKDQATGTPGNPKTWQPINLTGSVVEGKLLSNRAVIATITAFIEDPAAGKGFFEWGSFLVGLKGNYEMEIVITDSLGKLMTVYDRIPIVVRERA